MQMSRRLLSAANIAASTGPEDPLFDDIAVIQHDRTTGRTCFFQSRLEANLDGRTVPSPSATSPQSSQYWLETANVSAIGCTSCHGADPFIWSPYVAQKADLSKWDPLGKYDSNFADLFSGPVKTFAPPGNKCLGCHRFGRGPFNNNWTASIDYFIDQGKKNGRIIRVWLTK